VKHDLIRKWRRSRRDLRAAVLTPMGMRSKRTPKQALPEQPFDVELLSLSRLFRKSRETFLKGGGRFRAAFLSTPRTLSSPTLLDQQIQYSPIESEMVWAASDSLEKRDPSYLEQIRTYTSSLFHEQNHRILWRSLPSAPKRQAELRRYLNFAESLVITLDMALGDELGADLAQIFYQTGAIYDPGTDIRSEGLTRREYRNYLHAALYATYLNLELYDPKRIPKVIQVLYPFGELALRAAMRSGNLDREFITRTNLFWQKKHGAEVFRILGRGRSSEPLILPQDPMDNRLIYLFAETWFDQAGL